MPRLSLHERAGFWHALAAVPLTIGTICIGIGVAQVGAKADLWRNAWILTGGGAVVASVLLAWWGLTLHVAQRYAESHWYPEPQAQQPSTVAKATSGTAQAPLQPRYEQREPYVREPVAAFMSVHRIGIYNPNKNKTATSVRLRWIEMSPRPRTNLGYPPTIPSAVPMLQGGDANIGISLPPGQEELWVIASTGTGGDGTMSAGVFSPEYRPWWGTPWQFKPDDRWRLMYRIVADNLPDVTFSIVMTAVEGHIRCDLEG